MKYRKEVQAEARERLKRYCPAGTRVFSILRRWNCGTLTRILDLFVIDQDGHAINVGGMFAQAFGYTVNPSNLRGFRCDFDAHEAVAAISHLVAGRADALICDTSVE